MANNCDNDLYITGPDEDVAALLKFIGADKSPPEFDFNAVISYPAHFFALDEDWRKLGYIGFRDAHGEHAKTGFGSGGYEWCCEHWGTKWNAYKVSRRDYEGICVTFQTATTPPAPLVCELHKLFPRCTLVLEFFTCTSRSAGGFSCLSQADWYTDESWAPGIPSDEWNGEYGGRRG